MPARSGGHTWSHCSPSSLLIQLNHPICLLALTSPALVSATASYSCGPPGPLDHLPQCSQNSLLSLQVLIARPFLCPCPCGTLLMSPSACPLVLEKEASFLKTDFILHYFSLHDLKLWWSSNSLASSAPFVQYQPSPLEGRIWFILLSIASWPWTLPWRAISLSQVAVTPWEQ